MNSETRSRGTVVATLAFALAIATTSSRAALIHHWKLDEDTNVTDVAVDSASGLDGTILGATSADGADPATQGAFHFVYGDLVEFPDFMPPLQGTLVFWINPELAGAKERVMGAGGDFETFIRSNGEIKNELFDAGSSTVGTGPGAIFADEWSQVAMTYEYDDAAFANDVEIYVNGGELYVEGGADLPNIPAATTFVLGHRETDQGVPGEHYGGLLDDIQLYDEVLDADQILSLYEQPGSVIGGIVGEQLQAGDADMDCDFDQIDLVKVQVAAKYLTGEAATWGEGDWDGAPGGSVADKMPPLGNGQFDQLDIIAALGAGQYLQGTYCTEAGMAARAIPEPSAWFLLACGIVSLPFCRRRRT